MSYEVLLHPKADDFLQDAEKDLENRIRKKLKKLGSNQEMGKRLKHSDFWRLRIGDYRVIYEIDYKNNRIIILFIGHRKDVYDDFSRLI
jgi:mRNA interferase RelE/StbE